MMRAAHTPFFRRAKTLLAFLLLVLALAPVRPAFSSALVMKTEDDQAVTWTLTADKVTALNDSEVLEAHGNVVLRRGNEYLKADYARYYMPTKWVFLKGHVTARMGKDDLKAEEAEFDLRSRVGWLKKGEIFMEGPHVYFAGEHINKHWGDVYTFKKAKITACDGDVPAWSVTAEEAVVEIDGYAQLWRTNFQVNDVPVGFTPWMLLPAKKDRQSGFLTPEFGQSSRRGLFYNQPYFWAIDSSRDMTFNTYYMEKQGLMQGAQYRSRPSARESIWLRADYLSDKQRVTNDYDDPINSRDGLVRTNHDRYWLRGMYEGNLGDPKWRIRADLDYVSDQNYLHEFKNGLSGFNNSRDQLYDFFHRDLRERDQNRESGLLLFRDWERAGVALSATYTQNQSLGNGNKPLSSDPTVQRMPVANAYLFKGGVHPEVPLEIAASAEAGYMYRRNGTRGARYEVVPALTLPVNGRYGSILTTVSARQTMYETENPARSNDSTPKQSGDSRTLPEFETLGSTEFMRVFPLGSTPLTASNSTMGQSRWTALRHTAQPRVGYRNIPLVDQDDNPEYSAEDRIRPRNELTYGVTNILTRKRQRVVAGPPAQPGQPPNPPTVATDYLDVLRLKLEQAYDIREAGRTDERERYQRRPYSDITMESITSLDGYFYLINRLYWSPYLNDMTRQDHGVRLAYAPYGYVYLGLDMRRSIDEYVRKRPNDINSINFSSNLNVYGPWSLRLAYRYDYERREEVERTVDVIYTHQCFQLIARASRETGDESYQLMIVLSGIGD